MTNPGFDTSAMSDELLIAKVANGDREALGALYRRHVRSVRAAITRFVPGIPPEDRSELAHEVFLDMEGAAHRYVEASKFKSWLFEITVRKSRRWRRDTWRHKRSLEKQKDYFIATAAAGQKSPQADIANKQLVEELFQRLSAEQKEVLWLSAVMGFTGEEIGSILNIKPNTVWTRLHRARQAVIEQWPDLTAFHNNDQKRTP